MIGDELEPLREQERKEQKMKKGGLMSGGGSEWNESDHPRDSDGKFARGEGKSVSRTKSTGKTLTDSTKNASIEVESYRPTEFIKAVKARLATESNLNIQERFKEYIRDIENEPRISSDMNEIAKNIGSELIGYDFRIKNGTKDRFYQKVLQDPTKRNKDNVRYTMALGDDVSNYNKTVDQLKQKGYKPIAVKNYWLSNGYYKGINTNWESPDGTQFEMQFHSKVNHGIKEELHLWYEKERNPKTSPKERQNAREWQEKISAKFIQPKGVKEVK